PKVQHHRPTMVMANVVSAMPPGCCVVRGSPMKRYPVFAVAALLVAARVAIAAPGQIENLGAFSGVNPRGSRATGISDDGTVVGYSATLSGPDLAFIRPPGGAMTSLATFQGSGS